MSDIKALLFLCGGLLEGSWGGQWGGLWVGRFVVGGAVGHGVGGGGVGHAVGGWEGGGVGHGVSGCVGLVVVLWVFMQPPIMGSVSCPHVIFCQFGKKLDQNVKK